MDKELKRKLRALRKLKKETQKGTENRRMINKQIREVKSEIDKQQEVVNAAMSPEKDALIVEIETIYSQRRRPHLVDFKAYTVEALQKHLARLKEGKYL